MCAEGDLKSQLRRAAISVVSNIAEGSEHGSDREFHRFLIMANASNAEVLAQAMIAQDIGWLEIEVADQIIVQSGIVCRMLNRLMVAVNASG